MSKKVTINDIAQISGVSVSTVSLVLNKRPGVAESTRAKVVEMAEKLGYAYKGPPSNGKNGILTTVGMLVKRAERDQLPQENPFYSRVVMGIEDACRRKGINLLFATIPVDDNNHPIEIPALLDNDNLDGLLMVGAFVDDAIVEVAKRQRAKIILVDGYSDTGSFDAIVSDNFNSAYHAVHYLVNQGHRHIGFAGAPVGAYPSLNDRRNGYLRALKENGISSTYEACFNVAHDHGEAEIRHLLLANPQITALFCVNDEIAIAAIRVAHQNNIQVPANLSIIGYDDIYLARHASPPLTTMHVDALAMGQAAVQLLSLRIENPDMARMTLTVHTRLIERSTVSDING